MRTKQAILELLEKLPEDCTLDDVQYHLYVLQTTERGRRDIAEGQWVSSMVQGNSRSESDF